MYKSPIDSLSPEKPNTDFCSNPEGLKFEKQFHLQLH